MDGGAFLLGRDLRERRTRERHVAHEPAAAGVQVDESEWTRPKEPHAELPTEADLFDGVVVGGGEFRLGMCVVGAGERKLRLEHAPEVVDVVIATAMVVREEVEGSVEVVEQRCAGERGGRLCVHAELSPEGRGDLGAVGERDALVEEAEDRIGVDIGGNVAAVELGMLHAQARVERLQLLNECAAVVLVGEQPVRELHVEFDP